jgi:hypothetical protein
MHYKLPQECALLYFHPRLKVRSLVSLCSEPENLELRRFITRLDARINAKAMDAKRNSKYQNANVYGSVDRWVLAVGVYLPNV